MLIFPFVSLLLKNPNFKLDTISSYLEIGVNEGFSLMNVLDEFQNINKLILADTWGGEYGGQESNSHVSIIELSIEGGIDFALAEFLDGDSTVTIPHYFAVNSDTSVDLSFVDGNHSAFGALADLENVVAYSRMIAFHDIRHPRHLYLKNVFYGFYEKHRNKFYMVDDGQNMGYMIKKELFESG